MDTLTNPGSNSTAGPTQTEDASTHHEASQTLWTRVPRIGPSRAYGRCTVALRHPTRISRGVPTTVHGVLPIEIDALRPDRFQFAIAELDDWAVSDFRVHGVSQVRAVRDANGDDRLCRIVAFLGRELACTGERECVRLELVEATGLRGGELINAWNREHITRWQQEDLAAEIFRHARNFKVQLRPYTAPLLGEARPPGAIPSERVCRFEVRARHRLGGQSKISFWILADSEGLSGLATASSPEGPRQVPRGRGLRHHPGADDVRHGCGLPRSSGRRGILLLPLRVARPA